MKYFYPDFSHYQKDTNPNIFIPLGARMIMVKASDTYNLPKYDQYGNPFYEWNPQNHTDFYYQQNYERGRAAGLVVLPYVYIRFDRSIQQNLSAFQNAVGDTVIDGAGVVLDIEQSASQLNAAGLNKASVTAKAKDIFQAFESHYKNIIYTGSWWWDYWITDGDWFGERAPLIEADYVEIDSSTHRPIDNSTHPPSASKGWDNEYAVTIDDMNGKLFGWQFGIAPINGKAFDHNLTSLPKEELFKLTKQDGQVDPPSNDDNVLANELLSDVVEYFEDEDDRRVEFVKSLANKVSE